MPPYNIYNGNLKIWDLYNKAMGTNITAPNVSFNVTPNGSFGNNYQGLDNYSIMPDNSFINPNNQFVSSGSKNINQTINNPIGLVAGSISSLAEGLDNIDEQNARANAGREDLAPYVVGNTWVDIINSDNRTSEALQIVRDSMKDYSNVQNNQNLINAWNPNDLQTGVQAGTSNGLDMLADAGKGAALGASVGSVIPGIGTAIGTVAGTALGTFSGLARSVFGDSENKKRAKELNKAINRANIQQVGNFYDTAQVNNQRNLRQNMMNYFADGGNLEGLNGIIKVDEGGTHSQNPYDGVTMGIAPDGIPNKVEEGEIVYKDYVYSNRLKPSKTLLKNSILPEKYEGLTYAKIAEKIQKESEDRPNDNVSKRTLDEMMSRLMSAQEEQKAKIEERRLAKVIDEMPTEDKAALVASWMQQNQPQYGIDNLGQMPQQSMQAVPQEALGVQEPNMDLSQPMYAHGGEIFIKPSKRGTFTAAAKKRGMEVQEFASKVLANKDNYSPAMVKKATFARNVSKWHALGGHLFALGGEEDPFDFWAMAQRDNEARRANAPLAETPTPREEAILAAGTPEGQQAAYEYWKTTQDPELFRNATTPEVKSDTPTIPISGWQTMLRYAPVVGAGIGALVAGLQPVDYTYPNELRGLASQFRPISAPHIGGYRRYNPYDINLGDAENIALTAATLNANRGQNRATQGALNTAVINAAQRTTAQRNLAAQQVNEANRLTTDQYNLGIDQTNANLAQAYDQLNQQINNNRVNMLARAAQESDNTRTAWSNMYNATHENFFNQLGNVGRDEWNRNQFLSWLRQHPAVARDMGIDIG